jgi:TfoX/Sxy family transcriptional regulator of competence genes
MPYSERLADIIREAFADLPDVEEKKMFRGVCFMVDGKMCICISGNELMCRVGPELYEEALEKNGTHTMTNNGRTMKGYVFVGEDVLQKKSDFDYWINNSLAFNKFAKASKHKRKK